MYSVLHGIHLLYIIWYAKALSTISFILKIPEKDCIPKELSLDHKLRFWILIFIKPRWNFIGVQHHISTIKTIAEKNSVPQLTENVKFFKNQNSSLWRDIEKLKFLISKYALKNMHSHNCVWNKKRGATKSQSRTRNVTKIKPFPYL